MVDKNVRLYNIMLNIVRRDRNSKPIKLSTLTLDVSNTKHNYYH